MRNKRSLSGVTTAHSLNERQIEFFSFACDKQAFQAAKSRIYSLKTIRLAKFLLWEDLASVKLQKRQYLERATSSRKTGRRSIIRDYGVKTTHTIALSVLHDEQEADNSVGAEVVPGLKPTSSSVRLTNVTS